MLQAAVSETVFGRFLAVIPKPQGVIFPHTKIDVGNMLRPGMKPSGPEDFARCMVRGVRIIVQVPPRGDKPETKKAAKDFKDFAHKLIRSVEELPENPHNELGRALRRGNIRRVLVTVFENQAHGRSQERALEAYVPRRPRKQKPAVMKMIARKRGKKRTR